MVNLNKSFLYGICFASLTWIISLYLYFQITTNENSSKRPPIFSPWTRDKAIFTNESTKEISDVKKVTQYTKSNELIEKLKPVHGRLEDQVDEELLELGMVTNARDQTLKDEGYKVHAYNILVSNRLSLNRSIPDTRHELCKKIVYQENLPKASVVICFYNEHLKTLLRTVHSVLNRTPKNLLEEIILVDDMSDIDDLHDTIEWYIKKHLFYNVKLVKADRREGLIRARLLGARKAKGKVLIFLDSHVEVNNGWIEPLLNRIKEKSTNVVMPIIDIINADTFAYSPSPLVRGGFNWGLHFKWDSVPKGILSTKADFVKPIKSPTMAGGLFAIDQKYFIDIGEYDAGMNIWGGENLEISFRIWMCGGNLELIPCSRVGHIFRHRRPYGSPDGEDTMLYNSLRVANVWMDEYKEYFFQQRPDAKGKSYGDISSRIQLRRELKCNDFDWYLKNVYPELALPDDNESRLKKKWSAIERDKFQPWHLRKRNYIDQYLIRLSNSTLCIQSMKNYKTKGSSLILRPCVRGKHQMWYETDKNELVLAQLFCLQAGKSDPILYKCHEMGGNQQWKHKGGKNTPVYNLAAGMCLGVEEQSPNAPIILKLCTDLKFTNWDLVS